ncbi:oxidoreductase [Tersicoccus solisilvae]|uniref:Oxidoreductase n=1 Tax=Tersicoccus solisilvae TaxID=1882339 RepID=A0ABQ1PHS4_9MICC|nr:Gfo/Idh/MocA family oxidoreductase [Tersicoccus solisilvae]GGC97362.1 oxidoreductase [Tersicoccus solisilvae]
MTHPRLRIGIIGCGAIAGNHVTAYRAQPDVDVVACLDADAGRATTFATDHGIATGTADLEELFAAGLDAVSVCTPHPTHEALVLAAAAHGVHVLCEKPLAVDAAAAERMVTACRAAGVRLGAVFQRRWWPAARRIRDALDDGTLGTPVLGRVEVLLHRDAAYYTATPWRGTWATDGGGVLISQAIHYLDLLQWYLGDVAWVMAAADTYRHGEYIEVEDTLVATLRFTSGAVGQIVATTAMTPGLGERVTVTGAGGATVGLLEYPEGTPAINDVWAVPGAEQLDPPTAVQPDVDLATINAALVPFHTVQIADFVEAIREGRDPGVTGEDALRSLRTLTAIYASVRSGRPERPDAVSSLDAASTAVAERAVR